MKEFIVCLGLALLFTLTITHQNDAQMHQEFKIRLKSTAQEAAASAAQYFNREKYGEGYYIFNTVEGKKAINDILKTYLGLNGDLTPTEKTYWNQSGKIRYEVSYVDSDDMTFPGSYTFNHFGVAQTEILFGPSVIVTINAGKPRYKLVPSSTLESNISTGIHTFEE